MTLVKVFSKKINKEVLIEIPHTRLSSDHSIPKKFIDSLDWDDSSEWDNWSQWDDWLDWIKWSEWFDSNPGWEWEKCYPKS